MAKKNEKIVLTSEEIALAKALTEAANGEKSSVMRHLFGHEGWSRGKIRAALTVVHFGKQDVEPGVRFQHVYNVTKGMEAGKHKPELELPKAKETPTAA